METTAKERETKAWRFVNFCRLRFGEELTDDEIAGQMEFRSAEVLYRQLELDGSPMCGVCGRLYPEPDHRDEHKGKRKKRQPSVGGGRKVRLPNTVTARILFQAALEELDLYISLAEAEEGWLEGSTEEGRFKGKHFITHSVERDALEIARREEFTEEGWRELCEQYGVDPNGDQVVLSRGEASPGGVERTPSILLTAVVAAYALTNQPLTPLVKALHHEPGSAAWREIGKDVDNLRRVAGHLATRVRGGVVERGAGIEEVTREEHFVAWVIRALDKKGAPSDKEVLEELKKTHPSLANELVVKDIDRIRRERLEPPE